MKKILILASNPRKDLSLDREIRELKGVIERSRGREEFEVEDALAVRVGDLQELLFQHEPQIVHFCGHGGGQTGLVLEGHDGGEQWVQTAALRDLFRLFSSKVRCVLLNACYSEEQASEIVNHIDHVIGMEQEIRDDAAIAFSKGFYRALGYDCSIEEAYEFGCNAIQLEITGRSTVRSATTELTRKAEVVKAVATTIIPEHMKPILKKREGAFRAEEWGNNARQALPQTKKEAIQLELVQEVIDTPRNRDLSAQPMMNPSSVPTSHVPQSLLEVPAPRRRVAPLLVGSMVAGLLPVIGIYSYIKLAKPLESTVSTQSGVTLPPKPPERQIEAIQPEPIILKQAKELATQKRWKEAIATLSQIPETALISDRAQFLAEWSSQLLQRAQEYFNEGELNTALGEVGGIPKSSPSYRQAQEAIVTWNKEKATWDKINIALNNQWDIATSKRLLKDIQSPGLRQRLEAEIQKVDVTIQEETRRSKQAKAEAEARQQTTEAVEAERRAAWLNYKYAWLSERAVTQTDLEGQSASELAIMRNSIYAKYGFVFGKPEVQAIFSNEAWYDPISSNSNVDSMLSSLESNNAITIRDFEKKMGYLTQ